ncbi:MAG: FIG00820565: hypothetical protein, partial [uncultured Actinomycetospora sp.]
CRCARSCSRWPRGCATPRPSSVPRAPCSPPLCARRCARSSTRPPVTPSRCGCRRSAPSSASKGRATPGGPRRTSSRPTPRRGSRWPSGSSTGTPPRTASRPPGTAPARSRDGSRWWTCTESVRSA